MASVLFVCLHKRATLADEPSAIRASRRRTTHRHVRWHHPAEHVHPEVVQVMREIGIDLADRRPQLLTRELAEQADLIVTMGCGPAGPPS